MRLLALVLALPLVALALAAAPAGADERRGPTLVVLDRGRDTKDQAGADGARALTIVRALEAHGVEVLLLAAGASENGRSKVTAPAANRAGLAALAQKQGFDFSAATDPRDVLGPALLGRTEQGPVDVLLIGAFSAPAPAASGRRRAALQQAVTQWNERAPAGSRVFPLGTSRDVLAALEGVRGLRKAGWLVVSFGRAEAACQPFSSLPSPDTRAEDLRLEATVSVTAEFIPFGDVREPPALLTAATDLADDEVTLAAKPSVSEAISSFRLVRRLRDGRTATISFRPATSRRVTWLCAPPKPLAFTWDELAPDARLTTIDGGLAPVFEAIDAVVGKPIVRSYRLLRTRAGRQPAWGSESDSSGIGLRWSVGTETGISPDVVESELRVEFHAQPATPLDLEGTLVLMANGMPRALRLPFLVRVGPGKAALTVTSQLSAVPPAGGDTPSLLRIEARNTNVPATVSIEATCAPDHRRWLQGVLRSTGGQATPWPLDAPHPVAVGADHALTFELRSGAPADLVWPCTVTIRPAAGHGMETEGAGTVEVRRRRPRIVREGAMPALEVEDGTPKAVQPLILRLDPDGGDGDWLLGLLRTPPVVTTTEGDIESWEVRTREPGLWHVHPAGRWKGAEPAVFGDRQAVVRLRVAWERGEAPGELSAPVEIPARWGGRGWLFVILAVLATLLGVTVFVLMRAPRVTGTLLYVVETMPGTVGRLDLRPVGRRAAAVFADVHGRLSLASGSTMVARIRPTRVGGMLEVLDASGSGEKRLLVDGLAARAGQHMLRYVSGQPAESEAAAAMKEVPDLLGDEFDIESGRIDSL